MFTIKFISFVFERIGPTINKFQIIKVTNELEIVFVFFFFKGEKGYLFIFGGKGKALILGHIGP